MSKPQEKYLLRSSFLVKVAGSHASGLLKINSFRYIFQGFCLFFRNTYFKKHLCFVRIRSFPCISPFCVLPPKFPRSGPSPLTENKRRNALYGKQAVVLKGNSLKSFLRKSGRKYFLLHWFRYSKTCESLNLRKK